MSKKHVCETLEDLIVALDEARPTDIVSIVQGLRDHPMIEKVFDLQGMSDGFSTLVRTKDGNAYEMKIRPAEYSGHSKTKTKDPEKRERKAATKDAVASQRRDGFWK